MTEHTHDDEPRPDVCPGCGTSLVGAPIPETSRHLFGGATHFRHEVGVEIPGIYDGTLYYTCRVCDHAWPRFGVDAGRRGLESEWHAQKHNDERTEP